MARLYVRCPACSEGTNAFPDLPTCPCCGGEKFVASGLTEGQFEIYRRRLAEGTNFVGDDPKRPRRIWFRNGRTVVAYAGKDGLDPYLVVAWDNAGTPMRLKYGLDDGPPLDEDSPRPKAIYRVVAGADGEYQAWRCEGKSIAPVGEREADLTDAYWAILLHLGYYVDTVENDDDEDDFRAGCPTLADFGLDEKQETSS